MIIVFFSLGITDSNIILAIEPSILSSRDFFLVQLHSEVAHADISPDALIKGLHIYTCTLHTCIYVALLNHDFHFETRGSLAPLETLTLNCQPTRSSYRPGVSWYVYLTPIDVLAGLEAEKKMSADRQRFLLARLCLVQCLVYIFYHHHDRAQSFGLAGPRSGFTPRLTRSFTSHSS